MPKDWFLEFQSLVVYFFHLATVYTWYYVKDILEVEVFDVLGVTA